MKKLLLFLMAILTVSLYLSPVANAQQPCSANFQYTVGTPGPNGTITVSFYDSSYAVGTITSWQWTFSNGAASGAQNPVITVNNTSSFVACLTIVAYYQNVMCTSTYCDTVYINGTPPPPPCNSSFTYNIGSMGVSFSAALGSNVSWAWSFGDSTTGTGSSVVHTYALPGTYTVCLYVTEANGTACFSCQTITVGGPPPPCNANFTYAVSPQGVSFSSSANTTNTSWTWSFGDGTSGTGSNTFHAYSAPGTYTACLTVVDSSGVSCTSCQTITITSGSGCQAYYTVTNVPGTVVYNFTNQSQGNATYFYWNFGDGTTSNLINPSHTFSAPGIYNVCLTIIDSSSGCTDTYCDSLVISNVVLCNANFTTQVAPAAVVFIGADPTNTSWSWNFGDGSTGTGGPTATHVYAAPGTYNVCLTVTSSNGQTCTSCQSVTVQTGSGCSSNYALYPDSIIPHMYYAYNLATGAAPITYTWSWGDGTSSNVAYPTHTYAAAGAYTICLTITDGNGCTSTTCYPWQLLRLSSSSVPVTINVLPGTTGLNEQELINTMSVYPNPATDLISTGFSLAKESNLTINIINLAGQKVYSLPSTNYAAGSHEIKVDASDLPKGMYMIEIQSEGVRSHQKVIIQ